MRKALIIGFCLACFQAFAQQQDTTLLYLTLTSKEVLTVYGILGKQPADEVEQIRPLIASQARGKVETQDTIILRLPAAAVQYMANAVAAHPWRDVFQIMPKLIQAGAPKPTTPAPVDRKKEDGN